MQGWIRSVRLGGGASVVCAYRVLVMRKCVITSESELFITYLLRPRETVCFVDPRPSMFHKTHCFPEVSVNKCFIIYQ